MIVLASASPRRRELLSLITKHFEVCTSDVDEATGLAQPQEHVKLLAQRKARAVLAQYPQDTVIGADTVVYLRGDILEKPDDFIDAARMMHLLSGRVHTVYTGVCVCTAGRELVDCCATQVEFAPLSEEEIVQYLGSENVLDKAGAYAIQGTAAKFVRRIEGCYFNVVGLPVHMVYQMLRELQPD